MDDLDRWSRVLPLGAGAFGEVHLAWDHVDSRWVACKRFTGQDELGLLRMVIESRIRVSHPHLVRTLAFRLVDDRAWLVTELARGGSLRALMTRAGALPWGWVAEAVDQILSALTALHGSGVVHRDLKPANLLLRSFGSSAPHLLVGDFGIATWRTVSMTGIGAAIGTPGYLAPEYLDGHAPSPATDLFAVGVLAAEMLTGRRLVHYSNASPTMPSSWRDELPVPASVPRGLATVLQRMAAPDPGWRYTDCAQAREALLSAVPPSARGALTTVEVPDLLAAVPPGWTPEGPEPTQALPTSAPGPSEPTVAEAARPSQAVPEAEPASEAASNLAPPAAASTSDPASDVPATDVPAPNLVGLPIDGGPTALVMDPEATVGPAARSAGPAAPDDWTSGSSAHPPSGSSTEPATPPAGSSTEPPSGSATHLSSGSASPATPRNGSSSQPSPGSATSPSTPTTGSSTHPPSGSATSPPSPPNGSSSQPASGSATSTATPPNDSAIAGPPAFPATPPRGSLAHPPTGSATSPSTPPSGSAAFPGTPPGGSAAFPGTPPSGSAAFPATPPGGSAVSPGTPPSGSSTQPPSGSATSPATPPRGSAASTPAQRKALRRQKVKRKLKQAALLIVLIALATGGGAVWWATTHRTIPGHPSGVGGSFGDTPDPSQWVPTVVEPCAAVEIDSKRTGTNGDERCQRTPNTASPQSWVEEPPGGFPKSNAAGPFPGEDCTVDGDRDYSPVGDHVECEDATWHVIA